jgi:hypothetical protein
MDTASAVSVFRSFEIEIIKRTALRSLAPDSTVSLVSWITSPRKEGPLLGSRHILLTHRWAHLALTRLAPFERAIQVTFLKLKTNTNKDDKTVVNLQAICSKA